MAPEGESRMIRSLEGKGRAMRRRPPSVLALVAAALPALVWPGGAAQAAAIASAEAAASSPAGAETRDAAANGVRTAYHMSKRRDTKKEKQISGAKKTDKGKSKENETKEKENSKDSSKKASNKKFKKISIKRKSIKRNPIKKKSIKKKSIRRKSIK